MPHGSEAISTPDGRIVGYVSACEHGHVVGATMALSYLPVDLTVPGTVLDVDVLGERCAAKVVEAPLYDPGNERLRS